jgi:hypothetical protein
MTCLSENYQFYFIRKALLLLILVLLVSVTALGEPGHYSPSTIIPTKYRFLLLDMKEFQQQVFQGEEPLPQPESVSKPAHETKNQNEVLEAMLSDETETPSYSGLGRGYVETNFAVSINEPGRKVDDRERLTARGLFDVHIKHNFN